MTDLSDGDFNVSKLSDSQGGAGKSLNPPRLLAIGDIHGQIDALNRLLDKIRLTEADQLVFLGDYIDRGPDSFAVLEKLIEIEKQFPRTVFIRGNHDQYLMNWLFSADDTFLYLGGRQTRESYYRHAEQELNEDDGPGAFLRLMPESHLDFLDRTRFYYELPSALFVHGGIDPAVEKVEDQSLYDLLMGHRDFFGFPRYGRKIVVGHTSTEIFRSQRPVLLPNGIVMCDTSCERTGQLSAVELRFGAIYQSGANVEKNCAVSSLLNMRGEST